jgi:hypothetical protein
MQFSVIPLFCKTSRRIIVCLCLVSTACQPHLAHCINFDLDIYIYSLIILNKLYKSAVFSRYSIYSPILLWLQYILGNFICLFGLADKCWESLFFILPFNQSSHKYGIRHINLSLHSLHYIKHSFTIYVTKELTIHLHQFVEYNNII